MSGLNNKETQKRILRFHGLEIWYTFLLTGREASGLWTSTRSRVFGHLYDYDEHVSIAKLCTEERQQER